MLDRNAQSANRSANRRAACFARALLVSILATSPSWGADETVRVDGVDGTAGDPASVVTPGDDLRWLDEPGRPYRTPRAGEGFRTEIFGERVEVAPRDRRSVSAFDLGVATVIPGADESEILPFAAAYFWEHPDDRTLLRAVVVAFYNEVFYAKSPEWMGPFELVATFENFTLPVAQGELIDGTIINEEKMYWGYVRPGAGIGYRRQVDPGAQDNMFALDLTFEPSLLYFGRYSDTGDSFVAPQDSFEGRVVLRMRWDAMERNLLELPHAGYALGSDVIYGFRTPWEDWGTPGTDRYYTANAGRDYALVTGYAVGSSGVPFVDSDRHRLFASVHGGIGDGLDRFSAPRLGGGPDPRGEEYGSLWRPVLPGAVTNEFYPEKYAVGVLAYRWEPVFFAHVSVGVAVGWLDRERRLGGGVIRQKEDVFTAAGARVTSGFLWETRLRVGYSYNFDVIRGGSFGGHEVVAQISKQF